MARIVADGLELQNLDEGYWFEIVEGGLDGSPRVRGEDVTLPTKPGQTWMPKVEHNWPLTLLGTVHGDGATPTDSYRTRMLALLAIFDPTASPFEIVVHPDAVGVGARVPPSGTATITVAFLRLVGPPSMGDQFRRFELECVSMTDPPGWTLDEGGS